ncbi:zpr1 zinc finger domain-containing protein [Cystoisospora suis]|uniref:Zpr1 zinc finger domain-containing protein n=1 Tax=Cystoisospora suis TaxID=483139 RepID=A0A2C6LA66_9APIC|nr:zpr1 zinc finger domain-containing protein [Cystoisospora suis]
MASSEKSSDSSSRDATANASQEGAGSQTDTSRGADEPGGQNKKEEEDELLQALTEIESMCPNCQKNGKTLLLLHKVPHFKEIILMSFSCPHCNYSNREVQSAASLAPQGIRLELHVEDVHDLSRQVVRSEHAAVIVKEVELEMPPRRERGELNTVEGILRTAVDALAIGQAARRAEAPEVAENVEKVIQKLTSFADGKGFPFTLIVDDPSGNSYIEALPSSLVGEKEDKKSKEGDDTGKEVKEGSSLIPQSDPRLHTRHYERTKEQLHEMGFYEAQQDDDTKREEEKEGADIPDSLRDTHKVWDLNKPLPEGDSAESATSAEGAAGKEEEEDYVLSLPVDCPNCGAAGTNNACEIDVPGFRKCWIFSFLCQSCGGRHSEIKPAGAFGIAGRRWLLKVESAEDMNRDVLKSDAATVSLPSLDFSMQGGGQGGEITTVEGLLGKLATSLDESAPFASGDSAPAESRTKLKEIVAKLKQLQEGQGLPFVLVIDDCADMSFIGRRRSNILAAKKKEDAGEGKPHVEEKETEYRDGEAREEIEEGKKRDEKTVTEEDVQKAKEGEILHEDKIDDQLRTETYKRTKEQDDELGLTDMKV